MKRYLCAMVLLAGNANSDAKDCDLLQAAAVDAAVPHVAPWVALPGSDAVLAAGQSDAAHCTFARDPRADERRFVGTDRLFALERLRFASEREAQSFARARRQAARAAREEIHSARPLGPCGFIVVLAQARGMRFVAHRGRTVLSANLVLDRAISAQERAEVIALLDKTLDADPTAARIALPPPG